MRRAPSSRAHRIARSVRWLQQGKRTASTAAAGLFISAGDALCALRGMQAAGRRARLRLACRSRPVRLKQAAAHGGRWAIAVATGASRIAGWGIPLTAGPACATGTAAEARTRCAGECGLALWNTCATTSAGRRLSGREQGEERRARQRARLAAEVKAGSPSVRAGRRGWAQRQEEDRQCSASKRR